GVEVLRRWVELVGRLHRDRDFYEAASRAAWNGVSKHRCGDVERERVATFEAIAKKGRFNSGRRDEIRPHALPPRVLAALPAHPRNRDGMERHSRARPGNPPAPR